MNRYHEDYLDARRSIADFGWSRVSRLAKLRPLAGFLAWQENRRALSDLARIDAHLRADIGLAPDGIHRMAEDLVPRSFDVAQWDRTAANDNPVALAA